MNVTSGSRRQCAVGLFTTCLPVIRFLGLETCHRCLRTSSSPGRTAQSMSPVMSSSAQTSSSERHWKHSQRHEVSFAVASVIALGIRQYDQRLRRLTGQDGGDHFVSRRIDGDDGIGIFQSDINSTAVTGRPNAVWQSPDGNGSNEWRNPSVRNTISLRETADGDVSKFTVGFGNEVDVICDGSRMEECLIKANGSCASNTALCRCS